jgi:proline iminopeptidase
MQETLKNIISKSKKIYQEKNDQVNLNYINMLENMDSTSLEYSSYSFVHAMSNGFYITKTPNEEAKNLYQKFKSDSLLIEYASKMDYKSPQMFWKNEHYTSISLKENLEHLKAKKLPIYAMYGKEDGLYSIEQVDELKILLGNDHLVYLDNCSHNVFIDRQQEFIRLLVQWTD